MNSFSLFLLVCSFAGVLVKIESVSLDGGNAILNTTEPVPQTGNDYGPKHKAFLEKIESTKGKIPVIFWGDSLSEQWGGPGKAVFEEKYVPLGVENFGIGGDKTETLLWRLLDGEATPDLKTKVAVVMIGGNNAQELTTSPNIFLGIQAVVSTIREKMPNTKILLLGTLPGKDYLIAGTVLKDINKRAAALADEENIQFLNMYDEFLFENGTIKWELYNPYDKIHLVEAGYRVWSETMDPVLLKMIGSSAQSFRNNLLSAIWGAAVAILYSAKLI